ncbi:hypothetical protein F5Y06DRAFT_296838 [Hypoxylon sp. FL0890]|nr:hypothetical protein F5Y06DRAFT_296838 [Hypoxylon sp. FL0890]
MDLEEKLDCLKRKRLELTTPEPVDAQEMARLQQNPQVRELRGGLSQSQVNRPRDPNRIPQKRAKELTRDDKLTVRTLRKYFPELTYIQLSQKTGFTARQIQDALHGPLTPKKTRFRKVRENTQSIPFRKT